MKHPAITTVFLGTMTEAEQAEAIRAALRIIEEASDE